MSRILRFLTFCGMCISSLTADAGVNCIFDWESIETESQLPEMLVDYTKLHIATLTEGTKTYHYLEGPIQIKQLLDNSFEVYYNVDKYLPNGKVKNVLFGSEEVCYFLTIIRPTYFLPIAGSHFNYTPQASCQLQKGTLNILPAKSSSELIAPSALDEGHYFFSTSVLRNYFSVGGYSGNFTLTRV